jgi:hypothetical protein
VSTVIVATITATEKIAGREDVETVFEIIVFAFDERQLRAVGG